jgi:hypothetical protein
LPILAGVLLQTVLRLHAVNVIAAGTKTVEACAFAVNPAAEIVRHLPYPEDWKVVVVCNEIVWDTLMKQKSVEYLTDYAFTFQPNHVTFIRAKVFAERMRYTPEQVLRHELGHIMCKCDDEERAWNWTVNKPEIISKRRERNKLGGESEPLAEASRKKQAAKTIWGMHPR